MSNDDDSLIDKDGVVHEKGWDGQYHPKPGLFGSERDVSWTGQSNVERDWLGRPQEERDWLGTPVQSSSGDTLYRRPGNTGSAGGGGLEGMFISLVVFVVLFAISVPINCIISGVQRTFHSIRYLRQGNYWVAARSITIAELLFVSANLIVTVLNVIDPTFPAGFIVLVYGYVLVLPVRVLRAIISLRSFAGKLLLTVVFGICWFTLFIVMVLYMNTQAPDIWGNLPPPRHIFFISDVVNVLDTLTLGPVWRPYVQTLFDIARHTTPIAIPTPMIATARPSVTPPRKATATPHISSTPRSPSLTQPIDNKYSWTYELTGFSGNRYDVWDKIVRVQAPSMSWQEFKDTVVQYNPNLVKDGYIFYKDKTYFLPIESK